MIMRFFTKKEEIESIKQNYFLKNRLISEISTTNSCFKLFPISTKNIFIIQYLNN